MKRLPFLVLLVATLLFSCSDEYDDNGLWNSVNSLEGRVAQLEQLCKQMNTNISSLQTLVEAVQQNDYVKSVTPVAEGGKTIGYTITFTKSKPITIYHGKDGQDGQDGSDGTNGKDRHTPVIGVKQDTDGIYYWTLDGEWLTDDTGAKIKAQGTDGQDGSDGADGNHGQDGKDGVTPKLKIENGYWYISYDNESSWTQLGKATGENGQDGKPGTDGKDGDSMFSDIQVGKTSVTFVQSGGTSFTIPLDRAFSFEIRNSADTQPFDYSEIRTYDVVMENVAKISISKPNGWTAAIKDNVLKITAPTLNNYNAEQNGTVSVIAVNDTGQSIIQNVEVTMIQSEYIQIVDDNFKNYCLPLCNINKDGGITKAEAETVIEMDCGNREIMSLKGIEYFTSLVKLSCSNNMLTSIKSPKQYGIGNIRL